MTPIDPDTSPLCRKGSPWGGTQTIILRRPDMGFERGTVRKRLVLRAIIFSIPEPTRRFNLTWTRPERAAPAGDAMDTHAGEKFAHGS